MRAARLVVAMIVAAAATASAAPQAAAIRGRVVDDETGAPVRNARVALEPKDETEPVVTDPEGWFVLPAAAHGAQTLRASHSGYSATDVPPDAAAEIRLRRGGVITGRVLDSFGEPVPLMVVVAERVVPAGGRSRFERVAAAETDDTGAYRLFALPAGQFVVGLAGPRVMLGNTTATPAPLAPDARGLRIYFPHVASNLLAQRIAVGAGDAVEGINLTIDAAPVFAGVFTPAAARSARGAVIRGHVVRPDGNPVRRARVLLSSSEYLFSPSATIADGDGSYEFGDLRAGGYRISATDTSFRTVEHGQRGGADHGEPIVVSAGAAVDNVDVTIPGGQAISGRIVDEYGDPIENANVRVDRIGWSRGRARLAGVSGIASRQTDDRGRFRVFGLLPGRYVVSAVVGEPVPGWTMADVPGYLRTYYPHSTAAADAQLVEVTDDGDALDTEIALVHGRAARISGRAVRVSGAGFDGAVWLTESARSGAVATQPVRVNTAADGAFEFRQLSPGEYVIQAATSRDDVAKEGESGATFVQVDGRDVTNAVVQLSAGSSVSGRFTFDGASPPDAATGLSVGARPVDVDLRSLADNPSAYSAPRDDSTWELSGLNGPRRLRVTGMPRGWTLDRILANGVDVTDTPLSFGTADESLRDVDVILTDRATEIAGTVRDGAGRPFPGATIIAFSTDRSRWYGETRFVQMDGTVGGAFAVVGLPPGEYFVTAVDKNDSAAAGDRLDDRRFLESLVGGAARVTVAADQRVEVALRPPR
jgi:carboxypeptidase family protein